MYWLRFLPYLSLGVATALCFLGAEFVKSEVYSSVLTSVASNGVFFFVVYLFYDVIRQKVFRKEQGYIHEHIKRQLAGCIFNYLYFIKKIIYGYNLETNTLDNILEIVKLEQRELKNYLANQSYLGFQIFKLNNEVRNLFDEINVDAEASGHPQTYLAHTLLSSSFHINLKNRLIGNSHFPTKKRTIIKCYIFKRL